MSKILSDLLGTLENTFKIKLGTLSASGLTAARSFTLPDKNGTIAMTSDVPYGNLVRNSNFAVNQRAVSGTVTLASGAYGHDGWKAGTSGCTYTFSMATSGITTLTISAGSLKQIIPAERLPLGTSTLYLSWVGTAQGKIDGHAYSGTGQNESVSYSSGTCTVEFNTGTLSQVQLEQVQVNTYRTVPYAEDLRDCMRYYQVWDFARSVGKSSVSVQYSDFRFIVPMRTTPTCTYSGFVDNDGSGATAIALGNMSYLGASTYTVTGTATIGARLFVTIKASADL